MLIYELKLIYEYQISTLLLKLFFLNCDLSDDCSLSENATLDIINVIWHLFEYVNVWVFYTQIFIVFLWLCLLLIRFWYIENNFYTTVTWVLLLFL